jgi:hypothetical protein
MTPEEAQKVWRGNFGKELHKSVCAYCLPIFWQGRGTNGGYVIRNNGTAFILNCGAESFVVTAAHVYEGYMEARKNEELRRGLAASRSEWMRG